MRLRRKPLLHLSGILAWHRHACEGASPVWPLKISKPRWKCNPLTVKPLLGMLLEPLSGLSMKRRAAILFCLLSIPLWRHVDAAGASPLTITARTDNGWLLRFTPASSRPETIVLGIPFGATIRAELVDPDFTALESASGADEVSAQPLSVRGPFTLRYQRIAALTVSPVSVDPATGRPHRLRSASIRVTLQDAATDSRPPAPADPAFEAVYRSVIANSDEARPWRRLPLPAPADSSRDWFETGREYVRIAIADDGWYRITPQQLRASGAGTTAIDPLTLRLFFRGAEIPIMVRPDTSVEFHGMRNRGDSTFIDFYTDTSAYWLTWGETPGRRFLPVPDPPDPPGPTVGSAFRNAHFEENRFYYAGTTQEEVIDNGEIPGEGWYWERLFPGTSAECPFSLPAPDTASPTAQLRARFYSLTPDSPGVDHQARIWINDSLAGEIRFEGRTEALLSGAFPASWLKTGSNALRVSSVPTPAIPNLFALDWFEIGSVQMLRAAGDYLQFTAVPAAGTNEFRVTGLPGSAVEVRDLSLGRLLTDAAVAADSGGTYTVIFRDTLGAPRRYLVTDGTARTAPQLQWHLFTDIRRHADGADLVIITHHTLAGPARRMATHRGRALRTAVIDVQNIYDEFAFGVYDPTAVRRFLLHAFAHWPAPAPSQVLMLGDASWDHHSYLPTSVARNAVPAFGFPAGDAWFVTPDNTFLPVMTVGRIPAADSAQALQTVEKLIAYEGREPAPWNKDFLMITGGRTPGEQTTFNSRSESTIQTYLAPPPIAGTIHRAYKSSQAVIDGEHRERMRGLVRDGLAFMNFLGHSGGRVWNVDIGDPATLENTNGRLPFVSSVSCNIAAFAEPSGPQLAEEFLLAPGRGALAAWASSSLGYAVTGTQLVNHFLAMVREDSARTLGALTTAARIRLFLSGPDDPVVRAMVRLTPLIGDPLSPLAVPALPDFAVSADGIRLSSAAVPPDGGPLAVTIGLGNSGLATADSVQIVVTDRSGGRTATLYDGRIAAPLHRDSLVIPWQAAAGTHTLSVAVDPADDVHEANEGNNNASLEVIVSTARLAAIVPLSAQVVSPGPTRLLCTRPALGPGGALSCRFEVDTSVTFTSPVMFSSGAVPFGSASAEWLTPPLADGRIWFWRVRAEEEGSPWILSSFSTSTGLPPPPSVRLRQHAPALFAMNTLEGVVVADSGVVLVPRPAIPLTVRSLGSRADPATGHLGFIRAGEVSMQGRWWEIGGGFMVLRVDDHTGGAEFRAFDVPGLASEADSMAAFVEGTPDGNYLALALILDGRTNVTPALTAAITALGSTRFASLSSGASWAFLCRKGFAAPVLEGEAMDSVVLSFDVPIPPPPGVLVGAALAAAVRWDSLRWDPAVPEGAGLRFHLIGIRRDGGGDTLRTVTADSTVVLLPGFVSVSAYSAVHPVAVFTAGEPGVTPLLREWSLDILPPAEVVPALPSLTREDTIVRRGDPFPLTVMVFNLGVVPALRVPLRISVFDRAGAPQVVHREIIDSIAAGDTALVSVALATAAFPPRTRVRAEVWPDSAGADLLGENNTIFGEFLISGEGASPLRLLADGVYLMEGDFVSSRPEMRYEVPGGWTLRQAILSVDGVPAEPESPAPAEPVFRPRLSEGVHELEARMILVQEALVDTLFRRVTVTVEAALRLVHVYTYPNPFQREAWFVFTATGSLPPEELVVRIFTVAGRKIRELRVSGAVLDVGVNRVSWDGRDADGQEIANGYYFYQLSLRGRDGGTAAATGKLVRLR